MGKAYVHRRLNKPTDYYPTPSFLVDKLIETGVLDGCKNVLEPACGEARNIEKTLSNHGFNVVGKDIIFGNDFLKDDYSNNNFDVLVTNPPFFLFDEFVLKAKRDFDKFIFLGKVNFFGGHKRHSEGIWENLKHVYIFDRMVNYSEENLNNFDTGMLVTGWFVWDRAWAQKYSKLEILDVQDGVRRS